MNLRDYMMKNQGRYPKLGAKPKKGDRIRDNITGETYEIDMISRVYCRVLKINLLFFIRLSM